MPGTTLMKFTGNLQISAAGNPVKCGSDRINIFFCTLASNQSVRNRGESLEVNTISFLYGTY